MQPPADARLLRREAAAAYRPQHAPGCRFDCRHATFDADACRCLFTPHADDAQNDAAIAVAFMLVILMLRK